MAQRMESAAPAGGVMLSESTARLVEGAVVLAEPQLVRIKGAGEAVPARRLLEVAEKRPPAPHSDSTLVGSSHALTPRLPPSLRGGRRNCAQSAHPRRWVALGAVSMRGLASGAKAAMPALPRWALR